jgi:predicted phosphodiesterase
MRVALIADVHANDMALERVLDAIGRDGVDGIVCLGDVAGTGPQPAAALERLRATGCRTVMGNVDDLMLHPVRSPADEDEFLGRFLDIDEWCRAQLDRTLLDYVASFEALVEVALDDDRSLLCYHGSPRSFNDVIRDTTPGEELDGYFAGRECALYAGGHTHFQMLRRHRTALVVNCGSVGMAYDRTHPDAEVRLASWAEYALVSSDRGGLSVDLRRVAYDKGEVARAVRASGMPHADWLADEWSR